MGAAMLGVDASQQEVNHSPRARHGDEGLGGQALFLAHLAARRLHREMDRAAAESGAAAHPAQ
jgi:hippurate hydrolase